MKAFAIQSHTEVVQGGNDGLSILFTCPSLGLKWDCLLATLFRSLAVVVIM